MPYGLRKLFLIGSINPLVKASTSSSSSSTWRSSSSTGCLQQVVRRQRSEHSNPLRIQSHGSSLQDLLHIHDISSITALGASSPLIQSITNFSWAPSLMRNQPWSTGDGTSLFATEFLHITAWYWIAGNAYTSWLGMKGANKIPLHLS